MKALRGSVGRGGNNYKKEVVRIQAMLNVIPADLGGPAIPLKLDDIIGPKTIAAIEDFQLRQTGKKDGRVDRDGPTVKRLIELEDSDQILPVRLKPASAAQAASWTEAGLWHIRQAMGPDGQPKPASQVSDTVRGLIMQFFSLQWDPPPSSSLFRKQVNAKDLQFIHDKLVKMRASLRQTGFYTHIEYEEMYGDLTKPQHVQMCGGTGLGPTVNFAFCDPDPVNHIGAELPVRASAFLQASGFVGDPQDRMYGVSNFEWLMSGLIMPDAAMHMSACYLFFCQKAAGSSSYFFLKDDGDHYTPQTRARI